MLQTIQLFNWLDTYIGTLIIYIRSSSSERDSAPSTSSILSYVVQLSSTIILALIKGLSNSTIIGLVSTEKSLLSSLPTKSITVSITACICLVIRHYDIRLLVLSLLLLVDALAGAVYTRLVTTIIVVGPTTTSSTGQGSSIVDPAKLFVSLDEIF